MSLSDCGGWNVFADGCLADQACRICAQETSKLQPAVEAIRNTPMYAKIDEVKIEGVEGVDADDVVTQGFRRHQPWCEKNADERVPTGTLP